MAAILDLHWAAPAGVPATSQLPMADADHAPAFWSSVATTFKDDPGTVFDLFNEPYLDATNAATTDPWACWLNGCSINAGGDVAFSWNSAGMQQLVDAVRATGAKQPLMVGGLAWSNDLSGWLSHRPVDNAGQLAASFHEYNFNACNSAACWNAQVAPVAQSVPVITGEFGEDDCAGGFIGQYMQWADSVGVSYLGWTWDTWDCSTGPALIASYDGTPTAFGAAYRAHVLALAGNGWVVAAGDPVGALLTVGPTVNAPASGLLGSTGRQVYAAAGDGVAVLPARGIARATASDGGGSNSTAAVATPSGTLVRLVPQIAELVGREPFH